MARIPTSLLAAGGLAGGFALAQATKRRQLGGVVFAAATAAALPRWRRAVGTGGAAALTGLSVGALGASHPLAKKIGPWPSVAAVSGAVALATWATVDRRA
ncbi:S-formylglutathione hydrolase FrmB [Nocardia transvalensis]|uniref:S-formylglutathione hydrolase FrmB n=1 Tax=Nocardia transvalensis TaxID=37333 RepID=A0A7W9PBA2_9NOCA|nr:hypothetical protein [Nocardia transvalensis]MBB5912790.1 S-formylglutathione hydrolase FrmB [Nocardia transvalensis]